MKVQIDNANLDLAHHKRTLFLTQQIVESQNSTINDLQLQNKMLMESLGKYKRLYHDMHITTQHDNDNEDFMLEQEHRPANSFILNLVALKIYIKDKLPNENFANVSAFAKVAADLLSNNDKDLDKAKNAFNAASFMIDYAIAEKEINLRNSILGRRN